MSTPEKPIDFERNPTETLSEALLARIAEDDCSYAQESEFLTDDGVIIWMRVVEGGVQQILYRARTEVGESSSVLRGYSLELGTDGFVVHEWMMSDGHSPSDVSSNFQVTGPRVLDHRLVCDLLDDLSESEITNPELLCEYESTAAKIRGFAGRVGRMVSLCALQGNSSPELSAAVLGSIGR